MNFTNGNSIIQNTVGQLLLSAAAGFSVLLRTSGDANVSNGIRFTKNGNIIATTNNHNVASIDATFAHTGVGSGVQAGLSITHTIAQTAAGRQPVRAIYIKPTLTSLLGNNIAMEAVTGQIIVGDSRPSLNTTSGAVIIEGGLGVKGNIYGSAGALKQLNILAFGSSGAVTANYAKVARATAAGTLNLGEDFPTINIAGKHQFTNKGLTLTTLDSNLGNGLIINRTSAANAGVVQFNTATSTVDYAVGMNTNGLGWYRAGLGVNTVINLSTTGNISFFTGRGGSTINGAGAFGNGVGVINIQNALTKPNTVIPVSYGVLISAENDSFYLRNASGLLSTISSTAGIVTPYNISGNNLFTASTSGQIRSTNYYVNDWRSNLNRIALDTTASNTLRIGGGFSTLTTPATTLQLTNGNSSITSTIGQLTLGTTNAGSIMTLQTLGGATANTGVNFNTSTTMTNATTNRNIVTIGGNYTISSGSTATVQGIRVRPTLTLTATAAPTVAMVELWPSINSITNTTTLYGLRSRIDSTSGMGVNIYNIYADGSAPNLFNGVTSFNKGIQIKEGSNTRMGVATLVAGTVTVSNTSVTANTRIMLTTQSVVGTVGVPYISARVAGTSFTITSSSGGLDNSTVAWVLIEPA